MANTSTIRKPVLFEAKTADSTISARSSRSPVRDRITTVLLAVFVGSIPFEAMRVTDASFVNGQNIFTISKLFGYVLIAWIVVNGGAYFRFVPLSGLLFLVYFMVGVSADLYAEFYVPTSPIISWSSILQLIAMFVLFSNLFLDEWFRGTAIKASAFFGGFSALMMVLGFTQTDLSEIDPNLSGRSSAFEVDPNLMAASWAFAMVASCAVVARLVPSGLLLRLACLALMPATVAAIVQTASRGGIAAACGGVLVILVFASSRRGKRLPAVILSVLAVGLLYWFVANSEFVFSRLERSIREGDTSARIDIWKACVDAFFVNPLIGHGHASHRYILARIMDGGRAVLATHNTYLTALLSAGIFGFVPFVAAWILISVQAARRSLTTEGVAIMAMFATLVATNLTLDYQATKMQWIVLALVCGVASTPKPDREDGGSGERQLASPQP